MAETKNGRPVANRAAVKMRASATATVADATDTTAARVALAPVVAVAVVKTNRLVTVRCPFCGRSHTHGWPDDATAVGVRLSHCAPARQPRRNPSGVVTCRPYRIEFGS